LILEIRKISSSVGSEDADFQRKLEIENELVLLR